MNPRHPRRRGLHAVGQPPAAEVIDHGPAPTVYGAAPAAAPADLLAQAVRAELLADDWRAEFRAAGTADPVDVDRVMAAWDAGRDERAEEAATEQSDEPEEELDRGIGCWPPYTEEPGDAPEGAGGGEWAEVEAASDADLDAGGPPADELGRVANWAPKHDNRSLEYGVRARLNVRAPLQDRVWPHGPIFDQGMSPPRSLHDASGCTGYSMAAAVNICRPDLRLQDGDAFDLYLGAQRRDSVPGESYAGTSVLAAAQEAKARGWIDAYLWCFGVGDVAQALLQVGPVVLGIPWLSQMKVDADGVLTPAGDRGGLGHAIASIGIVREHAGKPGPWFVLQQSYGPAVGVGGLLYLHVDHLRLLLRGVGEACVPIIATKETP